MKLILWITPLFIGLVGSLAAQNPWPLLVGLFTCFILTLILYWRDIYVFVDQNQLGVMYQRFLGAPEFGLLEPGNHLLLFPFQRFYAMLSTLSTRVDGTAPAVHSADGIPLEAQWTVLFHLSPHVLPQHQLGTILPTLIETPHAPVRLNMDDCLRDVLGSYPAQWLSEAVHRPGLSRQVRHALIRRLESIGITVERLILGPFFFPEEFQGQVNQSQSRYFQVRAATQALGTMQNTIHPWNAEDRQTLIQLEQLRMLDENGLPLYPGGYPGWPYPWLPYPPRKPGPPPDSQPTQPPIRPT